MTQNKNFSDPNRRNLNCDSPWNTLYRSLWSRVAHWVYTSRLSTWRGQEDDIIADIVQEAISRTFRHALRAEQGEIPPLHSLERVSAVIAYHFFVDLRRRDRRLARFIESPITLLEATQNDHPIEAYLAIADQIDLIEVVLDNIVNGSLFERLAFEIVRFPEKQRRALLIDLSNRMHFGAEPTLLQQAFLKVGIQLQDYKQPIPDDPIERRRHASLVSVAYKRLKKLIREPQPNPAA